MTRWVLLGSAFLGPQVWAPVGDLLAEAGQEVLIVAPDASDVAGIAADYRRGLPAGGDLVLVPHSNAGLYVAGLVAEVGPRVRGVVYVDALLPGEPPSTPVTGSETRQSLTARAEGGLLPPWTEWWPEESVADLFPDVETRRAVSEGARRLPASYLDASVPTPSGWESTSSAYLGFGEAYAAEQHRARELGWPVEVLQGGHLHQLMAPGMVARALGQLVPGSR